MSLELETNVNINENQGCIMPSGPFTDSCYDIEFNPYTSKDDKNVPSMCLLLATCDSFSQNVEDVVNKIFLPKNTHFTNLANKGGILAYGDHLLSSELSITNPKHYELALNTLKNTENHETSIVTLADEPNPSKIFLLSDKPYVEKVEVKFKANTYKCRPPAGSYIDSCTITFEPYKSIDKNLTYVDFCDAKLKCSSLDGSKSSETVYFNINEKGKTDTVQKFENCNGAIVVGNLDDQCKADESKIKSRAANLGKTGRFNH